MSDQLRHSDFRIRKLIGFLGISIPFVLPALTGGEVLSSISHYYYLTAPSLYFIIVLSSLGLFLISYKGYSARAFGEKDYINDDWLTNFAGLAVLAVVLIPTACDGSGSSRIESICQSGLFPLSGHLDNTVDTIHLIAAGIFVVLMGWMSFYKFTRDIPEKDCWQVKLYRSCGITTWVAVGALIIYFLTDASIQNFVFWMEVLALVPFGVSWIIKGETVEMLRELTYHKK